MIKKNKILTFSFYLLILMLITYLLVNILIYYYGINFAQKYGASSYEIKLVESNEIKNLYTSNIDNFVNQKNVYFKSFFKYYTSDNSDLILEKQLLIEYNNLNRITYNLHENLKMISLLMFLISFICLIYSIFRRYQFYGYISSIILTLIVFFNGGILNYLTIIIVIGFIVSLILISKAKFIDYNKKLLSL